ncbi:2-haloacid dehalogenase [Rhodopseudomonas julia]|uniref:(S)-2-haloacid dehalogenase n=1 Tax=Rhodopseudomonas julia TaxID=200617 RepID=A0ABU0C258_9BRAD|nr:haloacid dehalogenase type II [Rhodopseudomonas julia]MDQ0324598.1 2-haloacid dehalogenase [Rhodopseudomonas julia]
MQPSIFVFDAYGTLFDVHAAVRRHAEAVGPDWEKLSHHWRAKQLEYSWVRSLMGRYVDFWTLTEAALDHAFQSYPSLDSSMKPTLLSAYRSLDCYPEVPETLSRLRAAGRQLAILSNGTHDMLDAAVSAAGLTGLFDAVLSVDDIRLYKTDERAYELATTYFRVYPEAISFQSSNRWDIAGATAYGFRTVWINRSGQADEYHDLPAAAVLPDLKALLKV